jgi:hypothetical protein
MNLIEQLGGYEKAKRELELKEQDSILQCCIAVTAEMIRDALLEYRRQHNIFEVGDSIVLMHTNYRSDVFALTKSFKEIYDEKGIVYRHATPEEIKAGKQL